MKDKTILVRCNNMNDLTCNMDILSRSLKLSNINCRVNLRKNEIAIYDTKIRFVTESKNIKGVRFDHWIFSTELENVMPKIIKTILDSKNDLKS